MRRPNHESLKNLPEDIYKKLPKKSLHIKTLRYLLNNHPKYLINILNDINTDSYDKIIILELLEESEGEDFILEALFQYSKDSLPAVREAAIYSMYNFPTENVVKNLEEIEVLDYNDEIRGLARCYINEILV